MMGGSVDLRIYVLLFDMIPLFVLLVLSGLGMGGAWLASTNCYENTLPCMIRQ